MEAELAAAWDRLGRVAPEATVRAAEAVASCLDATRRSAWPEVSWRASRLTNTGCPVELSWSSRDRSIRWTAEVTGPETPEHQRLAAARAWVEARGGSTAALDGWAAPPEPRFGAWVGGRHDASGDRYKLYVEATRDLGRCAPESDAQPPRLVWRMAGLDLHSGAVELYGRVARPEAWALQRWLVRLGITGDLLSPLRALVGLPPGDRLPGTLGVSVALAGGVTQAVALFVHGGPLLGDDDAAARRIRETAQRHGWGVELYDALLGDSTRSHPGRHGMLGLGLGRAGPLFLQVGLRP